MSALEINDLTVGYDRHPAVHHLTARFSAGSLTAIVGPNGAGKSTLLRAIAGVLRPLDGSIRVDAPAGRTAYLPQQSDIDRSFPITVRDLVSAGLWHERGAFGAFRRGHAERVEAALALVGLTGFAERPIGTLSGGQLQRALFARLSLQDASLVLLDEPFAAVDTATVRDLMDVVQHWRREGRTILAVMHDLALVRETFPQTLVLARDLIAHGETSAVLTPAVMARAHGMPEAPSDDAGVCPRAAA